jgi:hypothetical protein
MSLRIIKILTSWSRVPLEKLKNAQVVKKFPAFYGTKRFITMFTFIFISLLWQINMEAMESPGMPDLTPA